MATTKSLEEIMAYYNLLPFMKNEDWVEIGKKLEISQDDLKRVLGKTLEDYFFVMVRCYTNVEAAIVFNEALSKLTDTPSPDGLILFKDGKKLLVEVKSTTETVWKCSKGRPLNQKELAGKLGIDLCFAIFLNGYWGIYDYEFIESRNFKIEHPTDLKFSKFDSLFNPEIIQIPKGLKIIRHYSFKKDAVSPLMIFDPRLGHQIKYRVTYGNLYRDFNHPLPFMAFIPIELSISLLYLAIIRQIDNDTTEVIHECETDLWLYDYRFVLDPIQITISDNSDSGKKFFNTSSFIAHGLSMGKINFPDVKDKGLSLIEDFQKHGFPFVIARASDTNVEYVKREK